MYSEVPAISRFCRGTNGFQQSRAYSTALDPSKRYIARLSADGV